VLFRSEDFGRFGYGDLGITQSGMADRYSGAWSNRLLLNPSDAPVLEMLLGGVSLVSRIETSVAVTGAVSTLKIDGKVQAMWRSHQVKKDTLIEIAPATKGLRVYLSVKGGFRAKSILESVSVTPKENFGYKLQEGDLLFCESGYPFVPTAMKAEYIPAFPEVLTLRVLAGYQYEMFDSRQREVFFGTPYVVTLETDRMGCRLEGTAVGTGCEIISEPISYGAIQIPSDGQPIVLLNERQTIGGYPKIGTVLPMDCYRLAQARPGTTVVFEEVGTEEALRQRQRWLV